MDECQAEGVIDHPDFVQSDPQNLPTQSETSTSTGLFKTVKLLSDEQRCQLTEKLDDDQRLVLSTESCKINSDKQDCEIAAYLA